MDPLLELTLALLAAVGLICLLWTILGRLLTPVGARGAPLYAVVTAKGSGEGLEYTVRSLAWLRGEDLAHCSVILVDAGLDEEGRRVAAYLMERWPGMCLCTPEELQKWIV